jgi:hypothetical protein
MRKRLASYCPIVRILLLEKFDYAPLLEVWLLLTFGPKLDFDDVHISVDSDRLSGESELEHEPEIDIRGG